MKVASGASVHGGGDYEAFTEAMMKHRGQTDALSFHYYAMPMGRPKSEALGFTEAEYADVLALAREMEPMLTRVTSIMDKYDPERKVPLFVDEWGAWYRPDRNAQPGEHHFQQNSIRDAMVAALTINISHRHTDRVKMANIAQMVKRPAGTDPDRQGADAPHPDLSRVRHVPAVQGSHALPRASRGTDLRCREYPDADGRCQRGAWQGWQTAPVPGERRSASAVRVQTNLAGGAHGRILTCAAIDAHNSFAAPDAVRPAPYEVNGGAARLTFDVPAKSIVVVAVE